jgi:recombination protein RecA
MAMAIGDGHIRRNKNTHLCIRHSEKQKEYIQYKASLIEKITGKLTKVNPFFSGLLPACGFEKSIPYIRIVHKWLYKDGKKTISRKILDKLTPKAIAIWYMDDGGLSAKKRNGQIHAYDLSISTYCSEIEVDIIIAYFSEVWGITFTKKRNKGRFSVRCGTKQARSFVDLFGEYIIPSMQYKIEIPKRIVLQPFLHE